MSTATAVRRTPLDPELLSARNAVAASFALNGLAFASLVSRLPDLRSRLNALPVAELPPPDDAILKGVLEKFFRERNIRPTDDLIPYLLRRIERSIPRARDVVDQLDEAAGAEHRAVSRALARQILEIHGADEPEFD